MTLRFFCGLIIAWGWSRFSLCRPFNPNYLNFRERKMCSDRMDGMVRLQQFLWEWETGTTTSAEKSTNSAWGVWHRPWWVKVVSRRLFGLGVREQCQDSAWWFHCKNRHKGPWPLRPLCHHSLEWLVPLQPDLWGGSQGEVEKFLKEE